MTNNALLERLMNGKSQDDSTQSMLTKEEESAPTIRIVTARYKVYTFVILFLMFVVGTNYFPNIKRNFDATISQKERLETSKLNLISKNTLLQKDMDFMNEILEHQDELKNCLNTEKESVCQNLPESWGEDYAVPVSFLQLHSLHSARMIIDEKKILKNLNDYLIQSGFKKGQDAKNGIIHAIRIGDPVETSTKNFYSVPISFTIEFSTMDNLVSFVHNVERKLIDTAEDRILYKIQSIAYDIVDSKEKQTSNIELTAYYYYNPAVETEENPSL